MACFGCVTVIEFNYECSLFDVWNGWMDVIIEMSLLLFTYVGMVSLFIWYLLYWCRTGRVYTERWSCWSPWSSFRFFGVGF